MTEKVRTEKQPVAWNGLELDISARWEMRFPARQHLIFEEDFSPQLELRWQKVIKPSLKSLQKKLLDFASDSQIISDISSHPEWLPVKEKFGLLLLAVNKKGRVTSGIFGCMQCKLVFFFHIVTELPGASAQAAACLETLACHNSSETLWQFQDYSFQTPKEFTLTDYTFAAGLTRLSFKGPKLDCHTCRLGLADERLSAHSMQEILTALVDAEEVEIEVDETRQSCLLQRGPSIFRQILYRLKRQQPFILAKIWHDKTKNHLFALVLSSKQPLTHFNADRFYTRSQDQAFNHLR